MKWILSILVAAGLVGLSMVLYGWVLTYLWGWFIVPFFEVPTLPLAYAIGFSLTVRLVTNNTDYVDSKFKMSLPRQVGLWLLTPIVTLVLGWIVQMFI